MTPSLALGLLLLGFAVAMLMFLACAAVDLAHDLFWRWKRRHYDYNPNKWRTRR